MVTFNVITVAFSKPRLVLFTLLPHTYSNQSVLMIWFSVVGAAWRSVRKTTASWQQKSNFPPSEIRASTRSSHTDNTLGELGQKERDMKIGPKLLKISSLVHAADLLHAWNWTAIAPVVLELFTVKRTHGQAISRSALRRLVGVMSRGRL